MVIKRVQIRTEKEFCNALDDISQNSESERDKHLAFHISIIYRKLDGSEKELATKIINLLKKYGYDISGDKK